MTATITIDPDYIPISLATIESAGTVAFDVFCRVAGDRKMVLFCMAETAIHDDDISRLRSRGVKQLFIRKSERGSYQDYLKGLLEDDTVEAPISARTGALSQIVRDLLETSFKGGDSDSTVSTSTALGTETAQIVGHDEFTASDMFRVLHHDYATFTHSANVAFYAAMLAKEIGFNDEDVAAITTGGLLHDLGKLDIDPKILDKPGKLTEREFGKIKEHPTIGFRKLARREDLSRGQLLMVYQHHERLNGSGYPVGICGDDIHPWAKICAIVDVFEALTSNRPYRKPMEKQQVVALMEREKDGYDPEFLKCWKEITNQFWKQ